MARGHRPDPTDALFQRSARPSLERNRRLDELREQFEPEDLSDRAALVVRRALMDLIRTDLEQIRAILPDPSRVPERPGPGDLIDKSLMAVIPYLDLAPPALSPLHTGSPASGPDSSPFARARESYVGHARGYNELLMGDPEVFLAFEATDEDDRVGRYADLIGIPRKEMLRWRDEMRSRAIVPDRVRADPAQRGDWLARWHSPRLRRVVPPYFRPRLHALGRCAYKISENRMTLPLIEDFFNHEHQGIPGASASRLVRREPDFWLPRLPAVAKAYVDHHDLPF